GPGEAAPVTGRLDHLWAGFTDPDGNLDSRLPSQRGNVHAFRQSAGDEDHRVEAPNRRQCGMDVGGLGVVHPEDPTPLADTLPTVRGRREPGGRPGDRRRLGTAAAGESGGTRDVEQVSRVVA